MSYDPRSTNSRSRNHAKARKRHPPHQRIIIKYDFAMLERRVAARHMGVDSSDQQIAYQANISLTGRVDAFQPEFQQIKRR